MTNINHFDDADNPKAIHNEMPMRTKKAKRSAGVIIIKHGSAPLSNSSLLKEQVMMYLFL